MAEESQVIRGIYWREAFPFTHIFRAFRIAIHPSKLILALLALTLLYTGGRVLDALWSTRHRAVPGEIEHYQTSSNAKSFREWRQNRQDAAVARYTMYLQELPRFKDPAQTEYQQLRDPDKARAAAVEGKYFGDVMYSRFTQRDRTVNEAQRAHDETIRAIDSREKKTDDDKARAQRDREAADELLARIRSDAFAQAAAERREIAAVRGDGLFDAFFDYQTGQINQVVDGVINNNWLGGIGRRADGDGVLLSAVHFFTVAPAWALRHHPLYFLLFGLLFLFIWSLFGGAIARIAAVHVADEGRKLSMRQGLSFAVSKFLSFLSAPMIPLIIVALIGLIVAVVGGVVLAIPYVGEVVIGALFFLALAAGFVITLVLLGAFGGFNLMYPTIAVEGSDSFDAISRSFSYVYAKPWRMLFYSAVAIAYGALTYLFIRLFIWLMLTATWFFVGLFVFHRHAASGDNLWPILMPAPNFWRLPYHLNLDYLDGTGKLASILISFWVYLTITMLGAFAISFYFSASTIIYYLMRREVDATELDDVYLEQPDEDFVETPPSSPAAADAPASTPAIAPSAPPAGSVILDTSKDPSPSTDGPAKTYDTPPTTPPSQS